MADEIQISYRTFDPRALRTELLRRHLPTEHRTLVIQRVPPGRERGRALPRDDVCADAWESGLEPGHQIGFEHLLVSGPLRDRGVLDVHDALQNHDRPARWSQRGRLHRRP